MMLLRRPTRAQVERFLETQRDAPFTYAEVGATDGALPATGYSIDVYGTPLGDGDACFARAVSALKRFENYPRPWMQVLTDGDAAPREGLVFAAQIAHFGFYSLNGCRVLRVREDGDEGSLRRYGFSFGTLTGHEEVGEERFDVTLDRQTGVVRYDVKAFSRPGGLLARLGKPLARSLQRRFWRETCEAMRRAAAG